ncbi:hypothetical protein NQ317_010905 [Molorchus minor]|uniref:Tyr recombinase domain-containing protein n=1 Tax=Molorchus minor TaxID=1323400 RepID=A0ABQ9J8M5_9CUCU|nr:hypothetical protein NQ317_010905 [Molorchus minor]
MEYYNIDEKRDLSHELYLQLKFKNKVGSLPTRIKYHCDCLRQLLAGEFLSSSFPVIKISQNKPIFVLYICDKRRGNTLGTVVIKKGKFYDNREKPVTDIKRKKSKILTKSEIDRFLSSADDKEFLMIKYFDFLYVGLILGIAGACRTDELVNLTVDDIEDVGSSLIVKIPNTKTKIPRIFVVTDVGNMLELFRKYLSLRPPHVKHRRLFLYYKAGKCSSQPVGKNTMGKIPSVVASYLKLPDVACYTGHCLRRSSATLLADAGVDITTIKRHAGWKSTTVAEGYVENSIENKTKIANQVLVGTTTSAITKTVNVSESNIPSNINFENCTNVTFNLNVNK